VKSPPKERPAPRSPVAVPAAILAAAALTAASPALARAPDYLEVVTAYAEALLEKGRDTYGEARSPLIASALDRRTYRLGKHKGIPGIRGGDRALGGANPMHDQNLYQILHALSAITGDKKYAAEADRILKWFFENCQSPATGLVAWGEHASWDFERDKLAGQNRHEFFRPWVLWEKCWALAPEACAAYARGLWDHQIMDKKTGEFSRHGRITSHGPGGKNEYPRHAGFYIATWARAYERTEDPVYLTATRVLLDMYDRIRNPKTGAIPCCTTPNRLNIVWPESNLSLAVDLWDSSKLVPAELGARMVEFGKRTDRMFLGLAHDFSAGAHGFVSGAAADTLARLTSGNWTHTQLYATGYGKCTDAQEAMLCYLRYRQVGSGGYKALVVAPAVRYLKSDPDPKAVVYPGAMGDVIWLMLAAHELTARGTGRSKYLDRADHFARLALSMLFDGTSPLPKASSRHGHYEAITRGDTLMMALLKLWQVRSRPTLKVDLVYCDR